jgi:riboflavin kinase/FMN adenylyltransferase
MIRVVDWKELSEEKSPLFPVALTIGTFDSLHVGHQRLIRCVVDNGYEAIAAVCTFQQNPASVLGSRPFSGNILSLAQKIEKLEGLGVALVVLIDFSPEISKLTGKSFFKLLASHLDVKKLVVGYNFHMGKGRDTNAQELVGILTGSGTELEIVPATMYHEKVVSSSRIRTLVQQGRFTEVKDMLSDDFRLDLREVPIHRCQDGCRMHRSDIEQVLPRTGEYQVRYITDSLESAGTLTVGEEQLTWQTEFATWQQEFAGKLKEIRFLERE